MTKLPGFPFERAEAGGDKPPAKRRRKLLPWGKKPKLDYTQGEADMRGLNSGATSAAEFQLAAAIAAASIQVRDFGPEPDERRTLITTSFAVFHAEETDFPALVRKHWPGLSDHAIERARAHLIDIMRIDRRATEDRANEIRREFHYRSDARPDENFYGPNNAARNRY